MRALAAAAAVVLVDQLSKLAVRSTMHVGESVPVVPGVLNLTYVRNTGAAFGVLADRQPFFIVATVLVVALFLWLLSTRRLSGLLPRLAVALVIGGALGNLIDRVVLGRVTDFIDVRIWPVFNLADSAIVVGAVLLFASALLEGKPEPERPGSGSGAGAKIHHGGAGAGGESSMADPGRD